MTRLNWQKLVASDDYSPVMKLVHLAARMDTTNEEAYRGEMVRTRRDTYEQTLTKLANDSGCEQAGRLGEGEILSELNEQSVSDARSIVNTYNYEMATKVANIRQDVPRANRHTYAARLRTWENERSSFKDTQIAINTNLTARQAAQRDFQKNNDVEITVELVGPSPAAEEICQAALDMGRVPLSIANEIPMPAHLNCVHVWADEQAKKLKEADCNELWMGQ